MKSNLILLIALIIAGCQSEKFTFKPAEEETRPTRFTISSATINSGRLILKGTSLDNIIKAEPLSANLSGYTMEIENKTSSALTVKLTHTVNNSLALAIGTVLTFAVSTASAQTTVNLTIEAAVPSGSIVAFNSASCPSGWSNFSNASGRMLLGAGSGNTDALGNALTTRTLASVGGLEYTTGIPASTGGGDGTPVGPAVVVGEDGVAGASVFTSAAPDTTFAGDKADSNLPPYVVVKFCVKD